MSLLAIRLFPTGLVAVSLGGTWTALAGAVALGMALVWVRRVGAPNGLRLVPDDGLLLLLVLLVAVTYMRGFLAGQIGAPYAIVWTTIWCGTVIVGATLREAPQYLVAIGDSLVLYVVLNLTLLVLGAPLPNNPYAETGQATVLGALGLDLRRQLFPLALGVNGFGLLAGLAAVFAFLHPSIRLRVVATPIVTIALLLADSRGAMAAAALAIFSGLLIPRLGRPVRRVTAAIPIAWVAGTLVVLLVAAGLTQILELIGLLRSGGSLSGRDLIWASVGLGLLAQPAINWVIGYGHIGQSTSGFSQGYESMFSHLDLVDPGQMNVHSSAMQTLIDSGLIGVALVALVLLRIVVRASRSTELSRAGRSQVIAFAIYVAVAGAVDLTLNPNSTVLFATFLLIATGMSARPHRARTRSTSAFRELGGDSFEQVAEAGS